MKSIRYSDSEVNMLLCVIKIPVLVTRGRTQGQLTNTLEAVRDWRNTSEWVLSHYVGADTDLTQAADFR